MEPVYLALDDEITSVVEKMQQCSSREIVLVVPKGATILQSLVNIRLLIKKAEEFEKNISIVTSDGIGRQLCAQAGLQVFQSIPDEKSTKSRQVNIPAAKDEEPVEPEVSPEPAQNSQVKVTHYNASATEALKNAGLPTNSEPIEKAEEAAEEAPEEISPEEPLEAVSEPEPKVIQKIEEEDDKSSDTNSDVIVGRIIEEEPERKEKRSPIKLTRRRFVPPKMMWRVLAVVLIVLVLSVFSWVIFYPSATVTIHVPTESVKKTAIVAIDTSTSIASSDKIPGLLHQITAESLGEAQSTGQKQVGDKATGTVTISNSESTSAVKIAKNTALTAANKLVFRTISEVSVPGDSVTKVNGEYVDNPGKVDVSVIADQPGDQYNIAATTFTVEGHSTLIKGTSAKSMSGGTTKVLKVVSDTDIANAKKDAESKMSASALSDLQKSIPAGEIAFYQSVSDIAYSSQSHQSGDEADKVTVVATGKANGVAYRSSDMESVLKALFSADLPAAKNVLIPSSDQIEFKVNKDSDSRFSLTAEIEGKLIANINTAEVKSELRGRMMKNQTEKVKSKYDANSVTISTKPGKWFLLPLLSNKINVNVVE